MLPFLGQVRPANRYYRASGHAKDRCEEHGLSRGSVVYAFDSRPEPSYDDEDLPCLTWVDSQQGIVVVTSTCAHIEERLAESQSNFYDLAEIDLDVVTVFPFAGESYKVPYIRRRALRNPFLFQKYTIEPYPAAAEKWQVFWHPNIVSTGGVWFCNSAAPEEWFSLFDHGMWVRYRWVDAHSGKCYYWWMHPSLRYFLEPAW